MECYTHYENAPHPNSLNKTYDTLIKTLLSRVSQDDAVYEISDMEGGLRMNKRAKSKGRKADGKGDLTTADLVVLSLLLEQPMHGYDLLSMYQRQEVADWASISKAQLYYALRKLDKLKFLEGNLEDGNVRDRMVYKLTEDGLRALSNGLADPSWAHGRVAQPFTTWLGLSIHADPEVQKEVIHARERFLVDEIAKEEQSLVYIGTLKEERAIKGANIVRLTISQLKIELEWLRGLLNDH